MIAYTMNGPVLDVKVGEPVSGCTLKSVVLTLTDTNHENFLTWFTQTVMPRMSPHLST